MAHVLRSRREHGLSVPTLRGFCADARPDEDLLAPFAGWLGPLEGIDRDDALFVGGVGDGGLRERLMAGLPAAAALIHPLADVGSDITLGDGSVVCSHASLTTAITVGRHVHVSRGAAVGHDAVLGDYVSIMPLAAISGNVRIGTGAFIGTGAMIRQGITIGERATIGMGAVVVQDVPAGVTVVGNPARQHA